MRPAGLQQSTTDGPDSRKGQLDQLRRRRRLMGVAALPVAVLALGLTFIAERNGERRVAVPPASIKPVAEVDTLLFAVRGGAQPLLAVLGPGPVPTAVPIPAAVTAEVPGLGLVSMGDVAQLGGDEMRTAISNTIGMWVDDYAVTDLERLGAVVDRAGGLDITLPSTVVVNGTALGPGRVRMDGSTIARYLDGPQLAARWEIVLDAILAAPPALLPGDLVDTDGLSRAQALLDAARHGIVEAFPVQVVGTSRIPNHAELQSLLSRTFGASPQIVRVVVRNGSGAPDVGERLARALVPNGFRVVLSENVPGFGVRRTSVIANGERNLPAAQFARQTLGVGSIAVSPVPSGLAEITIVVGRDLSS